MSYDDVSWACGINSLTESVEITMQRPDEPDVTLMIPYRNWEDMIAIVIKQRQAQQVRYVSGLDGHQKASLAILERRIREGTSGG